MSRKFKIFSRKLSSWLTSVAIIAGTVIITMPVANAVAATSVAVSAKFNSAGLAACTDNILVTFTEPVCGDADCTEALSISNFVFTPDNGTGMQSISTVTHTAGNDWALLTMNAASEAGDTANTLRVEEVYTPSGMIKESSSLTISLTADTTAPTVSVKRRFNTSDDLVLQFTEPVADEQCTNAALVTADFAYVDVSVNNAASLDAIIDTADRDWVYLSTNVAVVAADDTDTLAPASGKVYDMVGNQWTEAATALSTFTADSTAPAISSAYARIGENATGGNDLVFVNFSEPVFGASTASGNLDATDFSISTGSISLGTHTAGNTFAVLDLAAGKTAMGTIDGQGAADDLFDAHGNALTAGTTTTLTDNTFPVIRGVWVNQFIDHGSTAGTAVGTNSAVTNPRVTTEATAAFPQEGAKMYFFTDATDLAADHGFMSYDTNVAIYDTTNDLYEFTQVKFDAYYQDDSAAVTLDDDLDLQFVLNDAADFTTPSQFAITTDLVEKVWTTVTIDLTGTATGTALASQVANPEFWGIRVNATTDIATSDDLYIDNIRFSRGASSKSNQVILEYSEAVDLTGDPAVGASAASTATSANMTTSKTLAGMGAFATGTLTTKTLTNTLAKSADGTIYTTTLADRSGGLITSASPVTLSGLFTPTANVTDIATNAIEVGSLHTPETVIDALDLTTAATAVTDFRTTLISGGQIRYGWTAPSQTAATFSHYALLYGTSAGVTVASTLWDESNDATLSTATTGETTVTSLTNGTTYYANLVGVDKKGIATSLVTEKSATPTGSGSTTSSDSTAPSAPTGVTATVNDSGKVVLTWTDPTATDLKNLDIAKSTGAGVDPASILSSVSKGVQTYTDTTVSLGDVVNYKLRAYDNAGNVSSYSDTVSITVAVGETSAVEEEPETAVEPVTVDLMALGESGQSGTATLTEADGMVTVEVALTGATGTQAAHIHAGTCAETGDVAHALTDLVDGMSTTVFEMMTLAELEADGPNYINVHDATDATVSTACGDLYGAPAAQPEEIELPENVVETLAPDETGTVVEETTVKAADQNGFVTIPAGTVFTDEDGAPYTDSFMPPTVLTEQPEVMVEEDSRAASDVVSIGNPTGNKVMANQPVVVYIAANGPVDMDMVYKIHSLAADGTLTEVAECSVVTLGEGTLFRCELTSFSNYVVIESEATAAEDVGAEPEEDMEEEVEEAPFTDTKTHWSKDYVADLYAKGIVSGKTATKYAPDDAVTRAEFTKIIVGAFGIDLVSTTGSFTDISGHWGSKYIEAAKAAGVIAGYSDKTFKPDAEINRAEALKILLEAAEVSLTAAAADFPDVKSTDWFAKYVNYASANAIVKGYADGTFGPDRSITRGEVAKIVSLMIAE